MIGIRVSGLGEARARLSEFGRELSTDVGGGTRQVADTIARHAHPPIRSGALNNSIRATTLPGKAIVIAGGDGIAYAGVINQRTGFLSTPANDEARHKATLIAAIARLITQHNN